MQTQAVLRRRVRADRVRAVERRAAPHASAPPTTYRRRGRPQATRRWQLIPDVPIVFMVFTYIAGVRAKLADGRDVPYFGGKDICSCELHAEVAICVAASSDALPSATVKHSNAAIEDLRRATPSNFKLAASIRSNITAVGLWRGIGFCSKPFEDDTRVTITMHAASSTCSARVVARTR